MRRDLNVRHDKAPCPVPYYRRTRRSGDTAMYTTASMTMIRERFCNESMRSFFYALPPVSSYVPSSSHCSRLCLDDNHACIPSLLSAPARIRSLVQSRLVALYHSTPTRLNAWLIARSGHLTRRPPAFTSTPCVILQTTSTSRLDTRFPVDSSRAISVTSPSATVVFLLLVLHARAHARRFADFAYLILRLSPCSHGTRYAANTQDTLDTRTCGTARRQADSLAGEARTQDARTALHRRFGGRTGELVLSLATLDRPTTALERQEVPILGPVRSNDVNALSR
jgi:hypothetical protein